MLKNVSAVKKKRQQEDESGLEEMPSSVQTQHNLCCPSFCFLLGFFWVFFLTSSSSIITSLNKHAPVAFSADRKQCL